MVYYGNLNGHTFLPSSFSSAKSVWQTSARVLTYSVDCVSRHPLMNRSTSVKGAEFLGTDSLDYFPLETGAHNFNLFVFFRYRLCPITQSHSVQFSYGISAWKKPICTPPHLPEVSPALPLNSSNVRLTDDGPLSSFQGRQLSASSLYTSRSPESTVYKCDRAHTGQLSQFLQG